MDWQCVQFFSGRVDGSVDFHHPYLLDWEPAIAAFRHTSGKPYPQERMQPSPIGSLTHSCTLPGPAEVALHAGLQDTES